MLMQLRQETEDNEARMLHPQAALSKHHERLKPLEADHRLPYKRDVDRIIHSKAYSRYHDKTQVVYLVENDHITHRSLHVQLVNNFAKGIAEILKLNLDLVEAIALGHDVGHPPFGHEGEDYLSAIAKEKGLFNFQHPLQSCRLFTLIEPLNLGLNVYDGFLSHDGAMASPILHPHFNKTWQDHEQDKVVKRNDPHHSVNPATLEGCLVKICDTISYVGRDIEDAVSLKIVNREEVPDTYLGTFNRDILTVLAQDIICLSYGKDYIALSDKAFQALKELRNFNFRKIYTHPKLKKESKKIKKSYSLLFDFLLADYNERGEKSHLAQNFLSNKSDEYLSLSSPEEKLIDYLSGMTDHYFVRCLENFILPKQIQL